MIHKRLLLKLMMSVPYDGGRTLHARSGNTIITCHVWPRE